APRWVELDQRNDLPARKPARLREVGPRARSGIVELPALLAVLQTNGELPRGGARRSLPRSRRAARARTRAGARAAVPCVLRGGDGGGACGHRRRQRLPPGRFRGL